MEKEQVSALHALVTATKAFGEDVSRQTFSLGSANALKEAWARISRRKDIREERLKAQGELYMLILAGDLPLVIAEIIAGKKGRVQLLLMQDIEGMCRAANARIKEINSFEVKWLLMHYRDTCVSGSKFNDPGKLGYIALRWCFKAGMFCREQDKAKESLDKYGDQRPPYVPKPEPPAPVDVPQSHGQPAYPSGGGGYSSFLGGMLGGITMGN